MLRSQVFATITRERVHQKKVNPDKMTIGEEILLLEEYIQKARTAWTTDFVKPEQSALAELRKVAAIAVRCLEHQDSIPERG